MKSSGRKAFTLIELLVVIAIIAILAAILFPVFAQAKRAAKGSVATSGAKQMALGQIMYTNDYDDAFSPTAEFDSNWAVYPWSYLQQPYMKNWSVLLDPTAAHTPNPSNGNSGDAFAVYGLWGMPPQRITSKNTTSPNDFTFGQQALGAAMTGGKKYFYDGIGGSAVPATGAPIWAGSGYTNGNVPSLTTTAIANPAEQVLISQAGNWDYMWEMVGFGDYGNGNDTPDNFDLYFSSCPANAYGCAAVICGPVARKSGNDPNVEGWFPWPAGPNPGQTLPTGITIWAGTDGHVKATPWKQLMGTTVTRSDGSLAIKAFWPSGS